MYPSLRPPFPVSNFSTKFDGKIAGTENVPIFAAETKHYGGRKWALLAISALLSETVFLHCVLLLRGNTTKNRTSCVNTEMKSTASVPVGNSIGVSSMRIGRKLEVTLPVQ